MLLVSVIFMVLVVAVNVRFVAVDVSQTVPVPERVHVPEPMVRVLVLLLAEDKEAAVTLRLLALKVPPVRVRAPEIVMLAPKVKLDVLLKVTPVSVVVMASAVQATLPLIVKAPVTLATAPVAVPLPLKVRLIYGVTMMA